MRFLAASGAGLAVLAHVTLFVEMPLIWQASAALILGGLLPGFLLVEFLVGVPINTGNASAPGWGERTLYSLGAGYATIVLGMLLLNMLPGALLSIHVVLFYDALILALAALIWRRGELHVSSQATRVRVSWLGAGLLLLALVAGVLRFSHLDYSEFQGDEARAILRAAAVLRGEAAAIYAHQKGPAEILIPALVYAWSQRLNEAAARLPFALAGFSGLFGVFLLGRRMLGTGRTGTLAGWAAAMLLALDGYLIGFARIVQYQSIVFLMVVLCLLIFVRVQQTRAEKSTSAVRYLTLAAILLATGLLAHYEAGLVAIPGLYLLAAARFWLPADRDRAAISLPAQIGALLRGLALPVLVGALLLALFYVPFVLHPAFEATYGYIAGSRIGGEFPYNNLADFLRRTTLYSPIYYIGVLSVCALAGLARLYARSWRWGKWAAWGLLAGFCLVLWRAMNGAADDWAWLYFALAFGLAWLAPRQSHAERALWIWLGALMVLMLFFVRTPNTHVYGFMVPWAVVAGMVLARSVETLGAWVGPRRAVALGGVGAAALLLIFGAYAYTYFAASPREALHNWPGARLPGYWTAYDLPVRGRFSVFGFPMRNGWKAVGALYAQGKAACSEQEACLNLVAPFTTNDRAAVADWYTRGEFYCPRDHRYYVLSYPVEPGELTNVAQLRADLLAQGYTHVGLVRVGGRDKIEIYDRGTTGAPPVDVIVVDLADSIRKFDRMLTDPWFAPTGEPAATAPQHALDYRLGEHIHLRGYDLARVTDDRGPALRLTLYWRTSAPLDTDYVAFNQVLRMEDFHKIGQRDGEPGCDQAPTSTWQPGTWQPGQTLVDRYYIPLAADAPPGVYTLLSGLYDRESGDRLPIFAANGDFVGDALPLSEIEIAE